MPDENRADDVEKLLSGKTLLEKGKQALITATATVPGLPTRNV